MGNHPKIVSNFSDRYWYCNFPLSNLNSTLTLHSSSKKGCWNRLTCTEKQECMLFVDRNSSADSYPLWIAWFNAGIALSSSVVVLSSISAFLNKISVRLACRDPPSEQLNLVWLSLTGISQYTEVGRFCFSSVHASFFLIDLFCQWMHHLRSFEYLTHVGDVSTTTRK